MTNPTHSLDLQCAADPQRLHAWLTAASDLPGFSDVSVADTWGIDDEFTWDMPGIGARMATLVEQAQQAGVFGVPGHTIRLRQVTTDDPDADPLIEHQVTLHLPSGATLAGHLMPADHLTGDDTSGVTAAIEVLTNTATVVNELLDAARRLATPPAPAPHRGFAALDLTAPASAAPETATPPPARGRRTRRHA
jgi:hypothetical protein